MLKCRVLYKMSAFDLRLYIFFVPSQVSEHDTIDDLQTRDTSTSEKAEDGKEKESEDTKQMKVMVRFYF